MSDFPKELVMASRIEELERDALIADNARLRKSLLTMLKESGVSMSYHLADTQEQREAKEALAATPEQSLARLRNQVIEECAVIAGRLTADEELSIYAKEIRAMKEPK